MVLRKEYNNSKTKYSSYQSLENELDIIVQKPGMKNNKIITYSYFCNYSDKEGGYYSCPYSFIAKSYTSSSNKLIYNFYQMHNHLLSFTNMKLFSCEKRLNNLYDQRRL